MLQSKSVKTVYTHNFFFVFSCMHLFNVIWRIGTKPYINSLRRSMLPGHFFCYRILTIQQDKKSVHHPCATAIHTHSCVFSGGLYTTAYPALTADSGGMSVLTTLSLCNCGACQTDVP